jgi:hypothetical protein
MFFCAFYGTTQFFGEEGARYKDSFAYREAFYNMHDTATTWENYKGSLFDGETTFDVVIPLITYIISSFTRNAKVFFLILGVIFGYFYGKNIEFVIHNTNYNKHNRFLLFLFFVFAIILPFWSGLNGLRMNIGIHIFFYGVSGYLKSSKANYLFYIILSGLFHFAIIAVVGIFFAFYFTPFKKYNIIYFVLFIITFLIAEANIEGIVNFARNYSPSAFQSKVEGYVHDDNVQNFKTTFTEGRSWHALYFGKALTYSIFYLTSITYLFNRRDMLLDDNQKIFLSFALILFSFANLINQLPSGGRFYTIAYLFAFIPITIFYSKTKRKKLFHFTLIPLLFFSIVNIRDGFEHITMASLFANPLLAWFDFLNQAPIVDYIK